MHLQIIRFNFWEKCFNSCPVMAVLLSFMKWFYMQFGRVWWSWKDIFRFKIHGSITPECDAGPQANNASVLQCICREPATNQSSSQPSVTRRDHRQGFITIKRYCKVYLKTSLWCAVVSTMTSYNQSSISRTTTLCLEKGVFPQL